MSLFHRKGHEHGGPAQDAGFDDDEEIAQLAELERLEALERAEAQERAQAGPSDDGPGTAAPAPWG